MTHTQRSLLLAAGLALAGAATAHADGFRSYQVCGGDQFQTCAAVEISVTGTNVTVRLWNLSANSGVTGVSTSGETVINAIGFYNVPAGVAAVSGSLAMTGPARPGDSPGQWNVLNGGKVNFLVDYKATNGNVAQNGIASGCASPGQLPSGVDLYQNPCANPASNPSGWVTLNFQITGGTWDPNTSDVVFRGQRLDGTRTECWTAAAPSGKPANCFATATPEPITMTLLATGLAGMGGAGLVKRRRQKNG